MHSKNFNNQKNNSTPKFSRKNNNMRKKQGKPKSSIVNRQITAHIPMQMPDRKICSFRYVSVAKQTFNVNAAQGGLALYMTSVAQESSGVAASYAYFSEVGASYVFYRVTKSRIKVTFWSLEAAKYQQIALTPSVSSNVPNTAASFSGICSQPFTKKCVLSPNLVAGSIKTLSHSFDPAKLFGRQFYDQDEYAGGAISVATPTTPGYWILSFYNPTGNTVTTGGIEYILELEQTVELYQLNRTDLSTLKYDAQNQDSIDSAMVKLELSSKALRRLSA